MKKILISAAVVMLALSGCKKAANGGAASGEDRRESYYGTAALESKSDFANDSKDMMIAAEPESESVSQPEIDPAQLSEKLVYTASLTIQSLEFENAVTELKKLISSMNGIITYEETYDNNRYWYTTQESSGTRHMSMHVRVPSKSFDAFLNSLDGAGKVVSRSTNVVNISRRYNDVSVQIDALEIQQKRLLEMMEKAETIEEMILVESRLTEVQTQLNQMKTERSSMDTDVEYSTVTIQLDEVKMYNDSHPNFLKQIGDSFKEGFQSFFYSTGDLVLWLIYRLPYLIIAAIAFFLLKKAKIFVKLPKIHFGRKKKDSQNKSEEA